MFQASISLSPFLRTVDNRFDHYSDPARESGGGEEGCGEWCSRFPQQQLGSLEMHSCDLPAQNGRVWLPGHTVVHFHIFGVIPLIF